MPAAHRHTPSMQACAGWPRGHARLSALPLLALCLSLMCSAVSAGWLWHQPGFLPHGPVLLAMLSLSGLCATASLGWFAHRRHLRRVAMRLQRVSDARRDRILKGSNDGWWEIDLQHNEAFVSERWRDMHGYGAEHFSLRAWKSVIHPDDRPQVMAEFMGRLRDRGCLFHEAEFRCVRTDRQVIWVFARGFFERDSSGRAICMSGSTSDITRSKRAEQEREAAREFIKDIAAHVPGMVYQYRRRPDGSTHFPYASQAIDSIFGVSPEAAAQNAAHVFSTVHPEDQQALRASIDQSARELAPWQPEFRVRLASGQVKWLLGNAMPQLHADGAVVWNGFITDNSARKAQELARQEAHNQTQAILANMVDGVITIDQRGTISSFNQAAENIFGYSAQEAIGRNISMLMPEPHRSHHDTYLGHYKTTGEARIIGAGREVEGLRKDGSCFPMSLSVSRTMQRGEPFFIGLVSDITRRRRDEEEIKRLAFYDPLTGLPNRRLLMDRLKQAMATSARTGRHGAVMFLDLDHFKVLNDTQGHDIGDLLLQQVAARLLHCVREGDSVARLGGDEFVMLLESLSDKPAEAANQAEAVAAKVLQALGQPYSLKGLQHRSTPSIGIVVFIRNTASIEDLLKMADVAMYQAKAAGRNTARFFDPVMQADVAARAVLEADLRNSLRDQDFLLHYQPQIDRQGDLIGAEALVRWRHPRRGMVSPGAFIPLAEETRLILPLGAWVLEAACRQLVAWSAQPAMARCCVAVNVSSQQFSEPDFVAQVMTSLGRSGARPERLKLELTESMLVDDVEGIIAKMVALKRLGVGFSLDDFGTGYSSLSYLQRLPLDQLKIDQSFVRDLLTHSHAGVIARAIIALGHNLGLSVIAEGVEVEDQHAALWQSGCDAFQGYLFGRPAPAQALAQCAPPSATKTRA